MVTAEKMKYLDTKASREYGMPPHSLMENAGRAVAAAALEFAAAELGKQPAGLKTVICCGKGNNGGDGLVAARYLKQAGSDVKVFILPPKETGYGELVVKNLEAAKAAGVPVLMTRKEDLDPLAAEFTAADLLLDALLGISAVTVSLNAEFVGSARAGGLLTARGEVLRAGRSLVFVRGVIYAAGGPVLSFAGVLKILHRKS